MADNMKILISAALSPDRAVMDINKSISTLANHPSLKKLELKIDVDKSFIAAINGFVEASRKLNSVLDAQNKVIKETSTEMKNLDGSITKVTQQTLASGEVIERTRIQHDANKKTVQEENKAYDAQRKTLTELEASLNGYTKASTKANYNKTGQINSVTNTYKNADTGQTLTVNTDADGYVNKYNKIEEFLKLQQQQLVREQAINKQREQIAKEEYNTRKSLSDQALKQEQQRIKEEESLDRAHFSALKDNKKRTEDMERLHYLALQRNRDMDAKALAQYNKEAESIDRAHYQALQSNQQRIEAADKQHYLALQQNQKRDQQYAQSTADTQQKINDARNKFSNNIKAVASLNELEAKLKSISNIGDFKSPLTSLNNDLRRTISQLNEGNSHAHAFGQSLKQAFTNIAMYAGIGTMLMGVRQFFSEGITYVNELNKSLTELSIVYMQGQDEVEKYTAKFHELAMAMGITTDEIAKGAVEFARQGLGQEEMFSRMEAAVKYATISNLDFSTSAKVLTATVNSMNVDINRASDVFSYLGDATATGADEIGQAMQRVGGTAGAVGVEFEKVSSWIATISSNTRESAYTIGNYKIAS